MPARELRSTSSVEREAQSLLISVGTRWLHTQAVAACAERFRWVVGVERGALLLDAALLHDVGYAPGVEDTGHHAIDGARYVQGLGLAEVASLVAHHTGSLFEAEERGLQAELAEFPSPDAQLLDALTYCDLSSSPTGAFVSPSTRIDEILRRYSAEDAVHRAVSRARSALLDAVRRAEALLQGAG